MKLLLASTALFLLPLASFADSLSEERVKELVLEAIRENPGIVIEAIQMIEERQEAAKAFEAKQILTSNRDALERDPNAPVLGNPNGDVTVVEFFDYNCPYCKRVKPHMEALLAADKNVRVVYREWPILGEGSVFAARAALASREQGKYDEFHWAMMEMKGRVGEANVMQAAENWVSTRHNYAATWTPQKSTSISKHRCAWHVRSDLMERRLS